jgi:hypothetical protein
MHAPVHGDVVTAPSTTVAGDGLDPGTLDPGALDPDGAGPGAAPYPNFAHLVASMPAGRFVGDAWRSDPWVVVAVSVADSNDYVYEVLREDFPPVEVQRIAIDVFCVPRLAAEVLLWHADERTWFPELVDVPGVAAEDLATLAAATLEDPRVNVGDGTVARLLTRFVSAATAEGLDPVGFAQAAINVLARSAHLSARDALANAVDAAAAMTRPVPAHS